MGQRLHLRVDLAGLTVRGFCHRCVCPEHRGLAREQFDAYRLLLDALEQALYARQLERDRSLIHRSDRGSQPDPI